MKTRKVLNFWKRFIIIKIVAMNMKETEHF